jgi:hypothetical protein
LFELSAVDVASTIDVHCSPQLFYTEIFGLNTFANLIENLLNCLLVGSDFFLLKLLLEISTFILNNAHSRYDVDQSIDELCLTHAVVLVTIHEVEQLTYVLDCHVETHALKTLHELILTHSIFFLFLFGVYFSNRECGLSFLWFVLDEEK